MRLIDKSVEPLAIRDYLHAQAPVGHGLDYQTFAATAAPGGGSRAGQLCRELTHQQFGLCAYTGTAIDERLGASHGLPSVSGLRPHNEHLKPQSICRAELIAMGRIPGVNVGDDMNHTNIVAALLVDGQDGFGAAHRENLRLPVFPTDPICETSFYFHLDGNVTTADPSDTSAQETITVLALDHRTLVGWRKAAIQAFVEGIDSSSGRTAMEAQARSIIRAMTIPIDGKLPEYCFAIQSVIDRLFLLPPSPTPSSSLEPLMDS